MEISDYLLFVTIRNAFISSNRNPQHLGSTESHWVLERRGPLQSISSPHHQRCSLCDNTLTQSLPTMVTRELPGSLGPLLQGPGGGKTDFFFLPKLKYNAVCVHEAVAVPKNSRVPRYRARLSVGIHSPHCTWTSEGRTGSHEG